MQTHFWACEDLRVLILIQMSKDLKKTYIVTNPRTFDIMAGLLYTVFFVTVSINPTKFKACIYLHSLLIKKKYHLNDAWGRQVGCGTWTERGRSPEKRLYCYRRVSFITSTSLKSISTISASNTGCPSMKMYLLVWGTQQCSASAWDTCFSEMNMEIIESCSNHNISEEESAQNFQAHSSPNPVLPIQRPWYLEHLWTGGRRNRELLHLWKPNPRIPGLLNSQIIYRKKVACWDGIWIYEGVLTSFKAGRRASGKV